MEIAKLEDGLFACAGLLEIFWVFFLVVRVE